MSNRNKINFKLMKTDKSHLFVITKTKSIKQFNLKVWLKNRGDYYLIFLKNP